MAAPTISELLAQLLDGEDDGLTPDVALGLASKTAKPKSKNALFVDGWTQSAAEKLTDMDWNKSPDGFELNSKHEVADAFSAAFDWMPQTDPNCEDVLRKRWYDSLLASPAWKQMQVSTQNNLLLSQMAATQAAEDYYVYAASLTDEEKDDAEGEDGGGFPGELKRHKSTKQTAEAAAGDVQDAQDLTDTFGFGDGAGSTEENEALVELFKKAKEDPTLRRIAELAGRYLKLVQSLQQAKAIHGADDVVGVELSNDISRLTASELGNLMTPELELDTLRRIVDGEAHCREYQSLASEARGPIMVLVDESGSMAGDPIAEAKALALALTWLAKTQNRWICLVGWSSQRQVRPLVLPPQHNKQAEVIKWCQEMWNGGTYPPVARIAELFEETGAPEGQTDLIWITDGCCNIYDSDIAEFNAFREDHKVRSFVLGIGGHPAGFEEVADEIKTVDSLTVESEVVEEILSI
jgi:uncharacterized protein with von Willebrand factor type A (vWA) domain